MLARKIKEDANESVRLLISRPQSGCILLNYSRQSSFVEIEKESHPVLHLGRCETTNPSRQDKSPI